MLLYHAETEESDDNAPRNIRMDSISDKTTIGIVPGSIASIIHNRRLPFNYVFEFYSNLLFRNRRQPA